MNVIESSGLGKRYGRHWALRDLDVCIPEFAVVGLVGPNGAGKSTLLHLVAGLLEPTNGDISVLGGRPGSSAVLSELAFVAQDAPLPRRLRLREVVTLARCLNTEWDGGIVLDLCDGLGLRADQRVGTLSGGQRAQLALALALAKRPRLLVLDEPVASLDPLARRTFLQALMRAVAERELTVVFSTHLLDDLERICDHLVLIAQGRNRLQGQLDDVVDQHRVLVGPPERPLPVGTTLLGPPGSPRKQQQLVRIDHPVHDPAWQQLVPTLEEIVLAHLAGCDGDEGRQNDESPRRHLEVV